MPRKSISEYRAKIILYSALNEHYDGWPISTEKPLAPQLKQVDRKTAPFAVKVDQGAKGRFKRGLLALNISYDKLSHTIDKLKEKGFNTFIIEPMVVHAPEQERYFSIESTRQGLVVRYANQGGVDIESNADQIQTVTLHDATHAVPSIPLAPAVLATLLETFQKNYFTFLEINPFILDGARIHLIDAAVEVDDAASYFVDSWSEADMTQPPQTQDSPEEQAVKALARKSPASFTLTVINPNGSVFLLLSGGGASIVVADEVFNQKQGNLLANYGEYSGNPTLEETYLYTNQLLSLLLVSNAKKKVLFIGGAVANFTDIVNTFQGILQSLSEHAIELKKQHVKVYVRRGGPRQKQGLRLMRDQLEKDGLLGAVHGPATQLTVAIQEALQEVRL